MADRMGDLFRQDAYDATLAAPGLDALARDAGIANLGGGRYRPPARYYGPSELELSRDAQELDLSGEKAFEGVASMATHPERFNSAFQGYMRRPMSPNILDRRSYPPLMDQGGRRLLGELM